MHHPDIATPLQNTSYHRIILDKRNVDTEIAHDFFALNEGVPEPDRWRKRLG
jgi:hypothetical protein